MVVVERRQSLPAAMPLIPGPKGKGTVGQNWVGKGPEMGIPQPEMAQVMARPRMREAELVMYPRSESGREGNQGIRTSQVCALDVKSGCLANDVDCQNVLQAVSICKLKRIKEAIDAWWMTESKGVALAEWFGGSS
jgi:hypothetical protein